MRTGVVVVAALLLAGCASTSPPPAPTPPPTPVTVLPDKIPDLRRDAEDIGLLLESTLARIAKNEVAVSESNQADELAAASMPLPAHRSVDSAIRLFSNDLQPRIQASLDRSAYYRAMINPILDEHRLPRALAYLPVIESGYVGSKSSRAGALGIWQFMPSTAREYGLRVDWWADERVDPLKSTRAAASFLSDLYDMFGDWSLALASYNAGPGRIRRTLKSTRSRTFWDMQRNRRLPRETRGYVPTFYATLAIVSDPQTYGFRLCAPVDDAESAPIDLMVRGPVTLDYIAKFAHIDPDTLYDLNPAYRQGIVPPGDSTVRIPVDAALLVDEVADRLTFWDHMLPVARYTVRKGDSLRGLGRRLGVSHYSVSAMNGGLRSLRAGDEIFVPLKLPELSSRLMRASYETVHVVRRGDTLGKIANKHGISARELADMNGISVRSIIRPGDRLIIVANSFVTAGM